MVIILTLFLVSKVPFSTEEFNIKQKNFVLCNKGIYWSESNSQVKIRNFSTFIKFLFLTNMLYGQYLQKMYWINYDKH